MDFSNKKIHMIGIKGVGMTALAELLKKSYESHITGSDTKEEFHTDEVLKNLKIVVSDFAPANINKSLDLVIYSSAYLEEHPERKKAKELDIKQLSYAEALSEIFNKKKGIMIVGSHGKTTSTALLGQIMIAADMDPTVIVGGTVIAWGSNMRAGKSDWMLIEGDEYQEKFLKFKPTYLLITNIDYDHPDTYPDKKSYEAAFEKMRSQTSKKVFYSPNLRGRTPQVKSDYLIGEHNSQNLSLVMAAAKELGIEDNKIKLGLSRFRGIRRRMEIYYQDTDLIVMDDYAHHPAEILATLKALKSRWPQHKVSVIFQPHTFSRTQALMKEFSAAFKDANKVFLMLTYSSAREDTRGREGVDEELFENIKKHNKNCFMGLPDKRKIKELMETEGKKIIITMGAGDVWQFSRKIAHSFSKPS